MIWRAHVYVRQQPSTTYDDIGELELYGAATVGNHVKFAIDVRAKMASSRLSTRPIGRSGG
jgi:hypothetical protein